MRHHPYQLPLPAFAAPWASCHLPGRAMSLKASTSTVPDRSEIGPYLGGLRSISRVVPQTQPHPGTSLVGLHPRVSTTNSASPEHLRGKAISPKEPGRQRRTARRSVPTWGACSDGLWRRATALAETLQVDLGSAPPQGHQREQRHGSGISRNTHAHGLGHPVGFGKDQQRQPRHEREQ